MIRNDVIGTIAELAAQEVMGVIGVWDGVVPWKKYVGVSPVQVQTQDQEVRLWMSLVAEYGVNLPEVALQVQDRVREMVERSTNLTVSEVNVSIHHVKAKRSETS
jgi:uncharacterized alkaline shock family protein YloU